MSITKITAGNIVVSTILFEPTSGTVALADVTCSLRKYNGTEVDLTADVTEQDDGEVPPVAIANAFTVNWPSGETDITGIYRVRWESNPPSPRIVVEDSTTEFALTATKFTTP